MPRWTQEARARQAELIRHWCPWKYSTGPRSKEGKFRSAQNGVPLFTQQEWADLDDAIATIRTYLYDIQKP